MTNPVLWLELRIRIRERKLWIVTCLYVLCLFTIAFISVSTAAADSGVNSDPAQTGTAIFDFSAASLLALLVILGPLASAGAISQEREQRTLPALLNTALTPSSIVWGKLLASWVFIFWLAALSLPFLGLGVIWGGVTLRELAAVLALNIAAGMVTSTIAVGLSGYFRRSLTSYLATGAVMFFWLIVWPIFGTLCQTYVRAGGFDTESGRVLFYVFYAHHVAAPLIFLLAPADNDISPAAAIPFALGVWTLVGLFFFCLARRGVRRGLLGKN